MSDQALRRGAALMASGTAVSRLLGLLRAVVLVAAIGATGQAADAFAVANKLPNVLYMLLVGGVLNAVLVPQVVRAYKRQVGQEYVDRLLTFGFTVLAGVSLVLTVAAPLLVALYTSPGNAPQRDLAVTFAYWCIPQVFFYGAYALLGQVLNARHSFGPYMWAPVVNNVVSIVGFVVFIVAFDSVPGSGLTRAAQWHGGHVALLAGSATLGVIAQATILFPALRRAGVRYQPRWGLRDSGLGRAGAVATWTLVGLGVGQLGYVVVSRVASEAPEAARAAARAAGEGLRAVAGNAAYDSAFLIFMLPHSLVTVSLATALFTRLAERAHDRDTDGVRASLSSGVRIVGVFTVLATAVIAVLAEPVTRLVMPTERPATVSAVASVVVAMILGLPAFGAWSMAQRVYYAYEDTRGMVPVQAVMAAVVVAGTMLSRAVLPPSRWVVGIGVAMSVSYVVGAVVAMRSLGRRLDGADGPRIVALHVRAAVAAGVAAAAGALLLAGLRALLDDGVLASVLACVLVGVVMVVAYVAALRFLRVTELDELLTPLLVRLSRIGPLRGLARFARPVPEDPDAPAAPAGPTPPRRAPRSVTSRPVHPGGAYYVPEQDEPLDDGTYLAQEEPGVAATTAFGPPPERRSTGVRPHDGAPRAPRTHRSRPHYPPGDPRYRPSPIDGFLSDGFLADEFLSQQAHQDPDERRRPPRGGRPDDGTSAPV